MSAVFRVDAIEPSADLSDVDRKRMIDNMCSHHVLDAERFPTIGLEGRYRGTLEGGRLEGELVVRGVPRTLDMMVVMTRDGDDWLASGTWEGRLTHLGITPFKAFLGTLRLEDWVRLRLDARLAVRS